MPATSERVFHSTIGKASWDGEKHVFSGIAIKTGEDFGIEDADELLNERRLDATIRVTANGGEDHKQKKLVEDGHPSVRVSIDVNGFTRKGCEIALPTISVEPDQMNGYHAEDFGGKPILLTIHSCEPIPEKVKKTSTPAQGQQTFDDHPDTGPRPKPAESAPAAKNGKEPHPEAVPDEMKAIYARGCDAGLLGREVTCPKELKKEERKYWQRGYEDTRKAQ